MIKKPSACDGRIAWTQDIGLFLEGEVQTWVDSFPPGELAPEQTRCIFCGSRQVRKWNMMRHARSHLSGSFACVFKNLQEGAMSLTPCSSPL